MIKTIVSALVAASVLAAPVFAQGTAPTNAAPAAMQDTKAPVKHKAAVKTHKAKHVAVKHRHHAVKKHAAVEHRKAAKHAKRHIKTIKQQSGVKHAAKKVG